VRAVRVVGPPAALDRLRAAAGDLRAAGVITDLVLDDDPTTREILTDVNLDDGAPAGAGRGRP
jgi:hypothetical protein